MPSISIYVSNDFVTDQRMQRIAISLTKKEYKVQITGIKKSRSKSIYLQGIPIQRLRIWPTGGFGFYILLQIRFFVKALFDSSDIFWAVDLDTLAPIRLAAYIKRKKLIWDCHEIYPQIPELYARPFVQQIWISIENILMPGLKNVFTVTTGVRDYLQSRFALNPVVVYNYPVYDAQHTHVDQKRNSKVLFFQGALNDGRYLDVMVKMMHHIPEPYILEIAGDGHQMQGLKKLVHQENLVNRVLLLGMLTPDQLKEKTKSVLIGLSLLKKEHGNSNVSLANKNLDYIMAETPCITVDLPEYRKLNDQFEVAILLSTVNEITVSSAINALIQNKSLYLKLHSETQRAKKIIHWESQEKILIDTMSDII